MESIAFYYAFYSVIYKIRIWVKNKQMKTLDLGTAYLFKKMPRVVVVMLIVNKYIGVFVAG